MVKTSVVEKEIKEVRIRDNTIYFYVKWNDNSLTWTRINNLSNKNLILDFARKALRILRQQKKNEETNLKKMNEEALRDQILKKQKFSFPGKGLSTEEQGKKDLPKFKFDKPKEFTPVSKTYKAQENTTATHNTIKIEFSEFERAEFKFYMYERFKPVAVGLSDCVFMSSKKIAPYIKHLCSKGETPTFTFEYENYSSDEYGIKDYMVENRKTLLVYDRTNVWVIYFTGKDNVIGNRGVLCKINMDSKLKLYKVIQDDLILDRVFLNNTFGSYPLEFENSMMKFDTGTNLDKRSRFIVNQNTYCGKRINNFVTRTCNVVTDKEKAENLIIQGFYKEFLHEVVDADVLNQNFSNLKIYLENKCKFTEIMKEGGILILSRTFVEYGPIDQLLSVSAAVAASKNWKIRIPYSIYRLFKRRIKALELEKSEEYKFKELYTQLKEGSQEDAFDTLDEHEFKNLIEKSSSDKYRSFLVIGEHVGCGQCKTATEVCRMLTT